MTKAKFEMPEALKSAPDAEAIEKVGQATVEAVEKAVGETIAEKMKELGEAGVSKETVSELEKAIKAQGSAITELKEKGAVASAVDFHNDILSALTDKSIREKIKSGKTMHEIEIKAAPGTITTSGQLGGAPYNLTTVLVPGVSAPPRESTSLLSVLSKGSTNGSVLHWTNRSVPNGTAAATAENALKPLVDFTITNESSTAKKITARMVVTEEAIEDEMYMLSVVNDVMSEVTDHATNSELLNGTGTGEHLKGILVDAPAYLGTSLDGTIVNAGVADAIYGAALQVRKSFLHPDTVIINPSDLAAIDLEKNANGTRQGAEARAVLASLRFIETSDMPEGKIAVLDNSKIKVHPYKGYTVRWGYGTGDFENNRMTVIAELRLHSYRESIYNSAIVSDTISNITGALLKPAV